MFFLISSFSIYNDALGQKNKFLRSEVGVMEPNTMKESIWHTTAHKTYLKRSQKLKYISLLNQGKNI